MHISLYQAVKAIKVSDEKAAEAVGAVEEHMAMKISEATEGFEARFSALESELKSTKWMLGFIGTMLAIIGLAPIIFKLI